MRVCFLTHYYPPEVGAPQTRIALLARTLATAGVQVTVHTGFPNYPDGRIRAPYRNRPWQIERADAITIVRSFVYPVANRGFAPRLLNHTASALSALLTARLSGPADVVVAETPPLFTAAAGAAYAAGKRAALIVNVSDRWPASAVELGMLSNGGAIAAATALELWIYRRADLITAPTEGIVKALEHTPGAQDKCRRVWPVVDVERFAHSHPPTLAEDRPLRVLYAGTVGLAQGLEVLLEAARLAGPEIVEVVIAGDGADAERLRTIARIRRIENVRFIGMVSPEAVPRLYAACDAAVVLLRDVGVFEGALPTKMFEAMAAGAPLVVSARGESCAVTVAAGAGLAVSPGSPSALVGAFERLRRDERLRRKLGSAGRAFARRNLGVGPAGEQWLEVLGEAVRRRRAVRRLSDVPREAARPPVRRW